MRFYCERGGGSQGSSLKRGFFFYLKRSCRLSFGKGEKEFDDVREGKAAASKRGGKKGSS